MTQAVSRRPFTTDAWAQSEFSTHGIYGKQSAMGQVILRMLPFSPVTVLLILRTRFIDISPTVYNDSNLQRGEVIHVVTFVLYSCGGIITCFLLFCIIFKKFVFLRLLSFRVVILVIISTSCLSYEFYF
jgi:hypothetical protein